MPCDSIYLAKAHHLDNLAAGTDLKTTLADSKLL